MARYNFCRVHQTLRVTPGMAAGLRLTGHIWTVRERLTARLSGLPFEEAGERSAHAMRRIYMTALFFTLTASAVHGQAPRPSPSEAVAVLRANRSPADLTDTPLFVPERPEALWLLGPRSDTPWAWPPEAFTPIAPLSRQPFLTYERGVHGRAGHTGGAFWPCGPFPSVGSCGSSLPASASAAPFGMGFDQAPAAFLRTAPPLKAETTGKPKGKRPRKADATK
jgi:hypothetical protein